MGVPPDKVPDVMALMGDSIDNIPGARDPNEKPAPGERRKAGIGEVGARQLIQQYGSAEAALANAAEVKRASYREALEKYGEFVRLSKQLATIPHRRARAALARSAANPGAGHYGTSRTLYANSASRLCSRSSLLLSRRSKNGLRVARFARAQEISRSDSPRPRNCRLALARFRRSGRRGLWDPGARHGSFVERRRRPHIAANDVENKDARRHEIMARRS